jgi:Ser/Thr protein kinase RdoA (MazF antagonist)
MRWLDGRKLTQGLRPSHFRAWGQMMARMHQFAAGWQPPEGFARPHWDWHGQLGGRDFPLGVEELVDLMPGKFKEPFEIVSAQTREVTESLGKGPDAYGMIHADMYPENVLFKAGNVLPIDFEDCGFGYWIWDLAIALCLWPWSEGWHWKRDALLEGYAQVGALPDEQLRHLDLLMAAQYATMVLWATMFIEHDPAMQAEHEAWREKDGAKLLRYFERP